MSILRNVISAAVRRLLALRRDDRGFVVLTTLSIFLFLFVMFSAVYAVGDTVHQRIRLQNACDAAAYSAAVVQADGLSRMATVNKALAWTYVQSVNRQMDCITGRWLKTVEKRYSDDWESVKAYHEYMLLDANLVRKASWVGIILAGIEMGVGRFFHFTCYYGNHRKPPNAYWCGLWGGDGGRGMHKVRLNGRIVDIETIRQVVNSMQAVVPGHGGAPAKTMQMQLEEQIKEDRKTIVLLNGALEAINKQMSQQMKEVAHFVLRQSLRENRKEKPLENVWGYFYIPTAESPYDIPEEKKGDQETVRSRNFFSPLYNTEPCERLFLQMAAADSRDAGRKLQEFFPVDPQVLQGKKYNPNNPNDSENPIGFGLDQWMIRGNGKGRTEGEIGLQRSYKSANLNESGAGLALLNYPVSRGNQISSLSDARIDSFFPGNMFGKLIEVALQPILSSILHRFVELNPSAGNIRGREKDNTSPGMCHYVSDTTALVADYSWASGKWLCVAKPSSCIFIDWATCRKCQRQGKYIFCDYGRIKHKIFWRLKRKHRGLGHYHVPKWYCGMSRLDTLPAPAQICPPTVVPESFLPAGGVSRIVKNNHGYMKEVADFKGMKKPLKPMFREKNTYSREEYESCATNADADPASLNFRSNTVAGLIKGHARIYGDDKEIYDHEIYEGEIVKPWVLNRRFFSGAGTIVVGAAMKHENPLVVMMGMLGSSSAAASKSRVFGVFNPVRERNMMWTMSAARAGYRLPGDGVPRYGVHYDDVADPENLTYRHGMFVLRFDEKHENPWKRVKTKEDLPDTEPLIVGGCCCDSENAARFRKMWNLCEQDWNATLLPLRFAGYGTEPGKDGPVWTTARGNNLTVNVNPFDLETVAAMTAGAPGGRRALWEPLSMVTDNTALTENAGMSAECIGDEPDLETKLPPNGEPAKSLQVNPKQLIRDRIL